MIEADVVEDENDVAAMRLDPERRGFGVRRSRAAKLLDRPAQESPKEEPEKSSNGDE